MFTLSRPEQHCLSWIVGVANSLRTHFKFFWLLRHWSARFDQSKWVKLGAGGKNLSTLYPKWEKTIAPTMSLPGSLLMWVSRKATALHVAERLVAEKNTILPPCCSKTRLGAQLPQTLQTMHGETNSSSLSPFLAQLPPPYSLQPPFLSSMTHVLLEGVKLASSPDSHIFRHPTFLFLPW